MPTVTPGYLIPDGEIANNAKLRQMAAPTVSLNDAEVTLQKLSAGVQASLAALSSTIVSVVAKSSSWTVNSTDKGKLFDVTTGSSNVTATLDPATLVSGWYIWLRKSDTGSGKVLTSPATSPAAASLSKQDQLLLIYSDGTNYYSGVRGVGSFDVNGNIVLLGGLISLGGTAAAAPAMKINGSQVLFRTLDGAGADNGDAPISASDGQFSGRVANTAWISLGDFTGTPAAIDASKGNRFLARLVGNVTGLTINNMNEGQPVIVCLKQDGTGSRTVAWTGITWGAGGSAPTQTATASKRDFYSFEKVDGVIYGSQLANF